MLNVNIISKLKILILLPLIVVSIIFIIFIVKSNNELKYLDNLKLDMVRITNISNLINELQRERGMSNGYLASSGTLFNTELKIQRIKTDKAFKQFIKPKDNKKIFYKKKNIELLDIRDKIDKFSITEFYIFNFYKNRINSLLTIYIKMVSPIKSFKIKNKLQSYVNLVIAKEALGQIRGSFTTMFISKKIDRTLLYRVIHAKGAYDSAFYRLNTITNHDMSDKYKNIVNSRDYLDMESLIRLYTYNNINEIDKDINIWWTKTTRVIDRHYQLELLYFESIINSIDNLDKETIDNMILNSIMYLLLILAILWLAGMIENSILRNISLLDEYKNAVDRSSIVTKTDIKGTITYANERFCEVSGHSLEELIGKPHNIIRHEDMSKEAFGKLWKQILDKKAWSGTVKNRKKDGTSYIVDATISPILNHKGEIEEFIAIRNDITENVILKEEIENTQRELILKMGEIVEHRSAETGSHVRRVAEYSRLLAKYYGLSDYEIEYLVLASPMHDIGKVGIPDYILSKPGKLSDEEWEIMKTHSDIGYELFKDMNKPLFKLVATIAYEHHEKYDGSGYPRGLKGDDIDISARITALADVYDAIGSDRCYKKAWSDNDIIDFIKKESGKHFDPKLVNIFIEHIDEFKNIEGRFKNS